MEKKSRNYKMCNNNNNSWTIVENFTIFLYYDYDVKKVEVTKEIIFNDEYLYMTNYYKPISTTHIEITSVV